MKALASYLSGEFVCGEGEGSKLYNPVTEEVIATASSKGLDLGGALSFAREHGGPALRAMTFAERGALLGRMAEAIHAAREELLDLSTQNAGNTRGDAKFDIDGATATLGYYAKLGERLGEGRILADGPQHQLTRSKRLVGRHVLVPRQGVAVLINAFNFPAWGFAEKAATAILAGMPVFTKAATSTAVPAARIAELLAAPGVMPKGVFSALHGGAGDLLDHLDWQDVVAFTGSSATGAAIRGHARVQSANVPVNVEADSLNAAVLAPGLDPDSDAYDLFLREVVRDMTQKAGQKCTAIRRIFVPHDDLARVQEDILGQLADIRTGNPTVRGVTVGPLANPRQYADVRAELGRLAEHAKVLTGGGERGSLTEISGDKGYFVSPTLFLADADTQIVHDREVFGPSSTLMGYDGTATQAAALLARGRGSLVSSVYGDDENFARDMLLQGGANVGRLHLGSSKVAEHSPGPGTVLPMQTHGGPGRAGGGEELGGLRGLGFYSQRLAVQGFAPWLDKFGVAEL